MVLPYLTFVQLNSDSGAFHFFVALQLAMCIFTGHSTYDGSENFRNWRHIYNKTRVKQIPFKVYFSQKYKQR